MKHQVGITSAESVKDAREGIITNAANDLLSSSSSDDEGLVGEDSGEDEEYDEFDASKGLSGKNLSLPGKIVKTKLKNVSTTSSTLNSKYQLMTCSTSSKSATNNDDIYLNNGNVDLKIVSPKDASKLDDNTKVEAESERGASREKVKKVKVLKRSKVVMKGDAGEDEADPAILMSGGGKKKRRRVAHKKRLIMNVAQTKYYVVRYVGKKMYKMKLSRSEEEDWDVCWQDGAVQCEQL